MICTRCAMLKSFIFEWEHCKHWGGGVSFSNLSHSLFSIAGIQREVYRSTYILSLPQVGTIHLLPFWEENVVNWAQKSYHSSQQTATLSMWKSQAFLSDKIHTIKFLKLNLFEDFWKNMTAIIFDFIMIKIMKILLKIINHQYLDLWTLL